MLKPIKKCSFELQTLKAEDFSDQEFDAPVFLDCVFERCNFTKSRLQKGKITNCIFKNCNLSLVGILGCRLQNVRFLDCKIIGIEFFLCDHTFFSVAFENCIVYGCNFSDLNMKHTSFVKSSLKECHFTNTILAGACFDETNLEGSFFHGCDLSKANFSKALNYMIDPKVNNIEKAKFSLPEAVSLLHGFGIDIV
jgi:uncharacterized protein YjbI with pentapeptide repeats